jgi:molybdenum cofactor synthesis domain-containing protein
MNLTVNGISHDVDGSGLEPLLDVLRDELGVTGPKAGCHQGGCGACTVLIDGEPRRSCLLPVAYAEGTEITTVEGLGAPENLAPIQQAFVHHYAAQCGFCTSGMMLAAHAYIERGGTDDRDAIAEALRDLSGTTDLILTTGGTGFAPRDVTPEATARVVERATPGLDEHMRAVSIAASPHGMLSRGRSGIAGSALIVNFPGSPRACGELFDAVAPALDHGLKLLLEISTAH